MSLTLRDVRVLRDALLADDDLGYAADAERSLLRGGSSLLRICLLNSSTVFQPKQRPVGTRRCR